MVAAGAAGLVIVASASASPSFPTTAAGKQASWLAGAAAHTPIPDSEIVAHFDASFRADLPKPASASLNATFAGVHRVQLDSIASSSPAGLVFVATVNGTRKIEVRLAVDARGEISRLHLGPVPGQASAPPAGLPEHVPAGVRQIPVGLGSPPLHATLTLPRGKGPFPAVVLVSGSGPSDQNETVGPNHPFLDIALGLAARGIATLRYDKRTRDYPRSIDPRTFTPAQEYVPDALAAIALLRNRRGVDPRRIFVLGHSLGGTYAPLIAQRAPEVAGVILLAAGAETPGGALVRQMRYLATLAGSIGAAAQAQLPEVTREAAQIDDVATLERDPPGTVLLGGAGPAYYLSELRYDEVATARSIPQPLLLLQGERDYQATVKNDLDVWLRGLRGRSGVTVVRLPHDDHLFLDGSGPPTPAEYAKPGRVDPHAIAAIAGWIERQR